MGSASAPTTPAGHPQRITGRTALSKKPPSLPPPPVPAPTPPTPPPALPPTLPALPALPALPGVSPRLLPQRLRGSQGASRSQPDLTGRPSSTASLPEDDAPRTAQLARIQHTLAGDTQLVRVLDDATGEVVDLQLFRSEAYPRVAPHASLPRPRPDSPWRIPPPDEEQGDWLTRLDVLGRLHRLRASSATPGGSSPMPGWTDSLSTGSATPCPLSSPQAASRQEEETTEELAAPPRAQTAPQQHALAPSHRTSSDSASTIAHASSVSPSPRASTSSLSLRALSYLRPVTPVGWNPFRRRVSGGSSLPTSFSHSRTSLAASKRVRSRSHNARSATARVPQLVVQPSGGAGRLSPILGSANPVSPPPTVHTGDASFDQEANANAQRMYWARRGKRDEPREASTSGKGQLIDAGHANYVLMYHMLTGIRIAVSRAQHRPPRPQLTEEDFKSQHKFTFDIVGNELEPGRAPYAFAFKDYAGPIFRSLREHFKLDTADYLLSLTSKYLLSELGSPGKSGSFFYYSGDYRFIIKTIRRAEHSFLLSILPAYHAHVERNPHTLLSRFYGLHRVKLPGGKKVHFVVMNNLFPPHMDIHETYDLKGSTAGRDFPEDVVKAKGGPGAMGVVMKDLNWLRRGRKILLPEGKREAFEAQLRRDVALLSRLRIMDYSLLIGIHDLKRGNKENLRQEGLHLFQADSRTPTNSLRMAVSRSDPPSLSYTGADLRHTTFYNDEGGCRSESGKEILFMGIIDLFTSYNSIKRGEHLYKTVTTPDASSISALPPVAYSQRFLAFILTATDPQGHWRRFASLPSEQKMPRILPAPSPPKEGAGQGAGQIDGQVDGQDQNEGQGEKEYLASSTKPRPRAHSLGAARSLWSSH